MLDKFMTWMGLAVAAAALGSPAHALTMAECSAKYQAAKDAGALKGMKWNDFRKAECGSDESAAGKPVEPKKAKAAEAANGGDAKGLIMAECSARYQAAKAAETLKGMNWNAFRKAECGPGASATAAAAKPTGTKAPAGDGGGTKGLAQCSAKYQAAKEAGTLKVKWNDFRKAECGPGAAEDASVPSKSEAKYTRDPAPPSAAAPRGVKFPTAVSKKYANEPPGKARLHTCLDEYYANKDAGLLNGLRWIQKGGGYYSLCNAKLKG